MHAYIITGDDHAVRLDKIQSLVSDFSANQFDVIKLGSEELPSIGIAQVREFQKMLSLAPAYGKIRLGIINFSETLTTEAQQALLKTLEEPPPHAKIILETQILDALLPTIVSRCQIISLQGKPKFDEKTLLLCFKTLEQLTRVSTGARLKKIEELVKTREDALAFVDLAIATTHELMLSTFGFFLTMKQFNNLTINSTDLLRRLLKAQRELSANVNPKLVLDNVFFKNLPP